MSDWRDLATALDAKVDDVWAEPVTLVPMIPGSAGTDPAPDPDREGLTVRAVFMRPGAQIVGEGGSIYGFGGNARVVTQDCWISICDEQMVDILRWRQHDRVHLPWRDETYSIAYIAPSATKRPQVHLIRVQVADL